MAEQLREEEQRKKAWVKGARREAVKGDRRDTRDNPLKAREKVSNLCKT